MKYFILLLVMATTLSAHNYHGCTLAPDNLHGWVVCLDTILILHTTNGGVTWRSQNPPSDSTKRFFDVTCFDKFRAWTCGILGEILHTADGGQNWVGQVIGLSKYATRVEFIDQNYGWAACGDGTVGKTTDAGNFWEQIFTPWYSAEFYGISFVNQLGGWIVAGYPDSMLAGQGLILHTTDGGLNWDSLYQVSGYEDFLDVHFFHLFDGVVVGGDENDTSAIIMKTTDGGLNWNPITAPANSYYLRAEDFVNNEGWAVGRFGTIIHSTDAGNTWIFQNNPATTTLFDVDFSDNLHGIACGQDIILYTTDGGQNWLPVGIEEDTLRSTPNAISLLQVYPNPFSRKTDIRCKMVDGRCMMKDISLNIYDVTGRLVKTFSLLTFDFSLPMSVGWHGNDNFGRQVPEGIYFVRLQVSGYRQTEKIIYLK